MTDKLLYTKKILEDGTEKYELYGSFDDAWRNGKIPRPKGSYLLEIKEGGFSCTEIKNINQGYLQLRATWEKAQSAMIAYFIESYGKTISPLNFIERLRDILIEQTMINHIKENVKEYEENGW